MIKFLNLFSIIEESKLKNISIFLLVLFCLFIAFNNHPITFAFWETAEIYKNFLPTKKPWLVLSISEDPVLFGPFNTFGYAGLAISRYISDYIGHSVSNIRIPSVVYGLIALFLFYIIINRWFGWKAALISTFILATNQYFLKFQHFLLSPMITLTSILFCIERFQNLLIKNNKFSITSFAFACALTTLNYWTSRWCMMGILLFYLIDFERFSIFKLKSYYFLTSLKRIKSFFLIILITIFILTIFFPGNLFLLFTPDFVYPSVRVGEYSAELLKTLYNIFHNLEYYLKYFILNRSYLPSDLLVYIPYQIENTPILILAFMGIVISIIKKNTYSFLFILFMFFITFIPPLFSETNNSVFYAASTSFTIHRAFFSVPFICILSTIAFKYIYFFTLNINYRSKFFFIFLLLVFFCFRSYSYYIEVKRSNNVINSYQIDFSLPAKADGIKKRVDISFEQQREYHYDQTYFYRLSQYVSKKLKSKDTDLNKINLIYIPSEIYTPFNYSTGGGLVPLKGYPYYFPMFLTFYLQEQGMNVSYLVNKEDIKESFFKKAITVIDRYEKNKNLSSSTLFNNDFYPRNQKQVNIVKIFSKIIYFFEKFEFGKEWLVSIRNEAINSNNMISLGDYVINKTSNKKPDYLVIVNEEELDIANKQRDYDLVLSLPLL